MGVNWPSWSELIEVLVPLAVLSYLIVTGFVVIVLSAVQEAARRREMDTTYGIRRWPEWKLLAASALIALPSLIIMIPIAVLVAL